MVPVPTTSTQVFLFPQIARTTSLSGGLGFWALFISPRKLSLSIYVDIHSRVLSRREDGRETVEEQLPLVWPEGSTLPSLLIYFVSWVVSCDSPSRFGAVPLWAARPISSGLAGERVALHSTYTSGCYPNLIPLVNTPGSSFSIWTPHLKVIYILITLQVNLEMQHVSGYTQHDETL